MAVEGGPVTPQLPHQQELSSREKQLPTVQGGICGPEAVVLNKIFLFVILDPKGSIGRVKIIWYLDSPQTSTDPQTQSLSFLTFGLKLSILCEHMVPLFEVQ